jgi:hypothetical protein
MIANLSDIGGAMMQKNYCPTISKDNRILEGTDLRKLNCEK